MNFLHITSGCSTESATSRMSRAAVASISQEEIMRMSCDDLIGAIEAGGLPLHRGVNLSQRDRATLEKLAYRARMSCRNRMN